MAVIGDTRDHRCRSLGVTLSLVRDLPSMSFDPAQLQALMAQVQGAQAAAAAPHLSFKAGVLTQSGSTLTADPRRGTIKFVTEDGVLHLRWTLRPSDVQELDLMLFADSWSWTRVSECEDGRVYVMKFKDNPAHHFFWLQEPVDAAKDSELEAKMALLTKGETNFSSVTSAATASTATSATASGSATTTATMQPTPAPAPAATAGSENDTARFQRLIQQALAAGRPGAAATPAATPAAAGVTDANALARLLQSQLAQSQQHQPRYHLLDILDPERVMANLSEGDLVQLVSELPPNDHAISSISSHLRSPQFQQAVQRINSLLYSPNYGALMASLGLPVEGFGVEGLIQAIQQQAQVSAPPSSSGATDTASNDSKPAPK